MSDKMIATSETVKELFNRTDRYRVPIYQRLYAWEEQQCQEFWNDLQRQVKRSKHNSTSAHFLGTLLLSKTSSIEKHIDEYYIIDGQQRLTTVSLLLAALRIFLVSHKAEISKTDTILSTIFNVTLARLSKALSIPEDEISSGNSDYKYKLHLIDEDFEVYKTIIENSIQDYPSSFSIKKVNSKINLSYLFFKEKLDHLYKTKNFKESIEKVLSVSETVLDNLKFITTVLGKEDDVNQIFESINNRGIPLTEEDLIKNYLMMTSPTQTSADKLYKSYWRQYESVTWWRQKRKGAKQTGATTNFGFFLYNYLAQAENTSTVPELQNLVQDFRQYVEKLLRKNSNSQTKEKILEELLISINAKSEQFMDFSLLLMDQPDGRQRRPPKQLSNTAKNAYQIRLEEFIERTVQIEPNIWPFILWISSAERGFNEGDVIETLNLVEAWLVRRDISRSKNTKQGIFSLLRDLKKEKDIANFTRRWLLEATAESATTPSDERIEEALLRYSSRITTKLASVILFTYEDNKKGRNAIRSSRVTNQIEHILPKAWTLKTYPLNETNKEDREYNIHKIGNLTLLHHQKNTDIGNKEYSFKRVAYTQQDLEVTKEIAINYAIWTDKEIDLRTKELVKYICLQWPKVKHQNASRKTH